MSAPDLTISAEDNLRLLARMQDFRLKDDLLKWVLYSFPWGQPKTPLAKYKGPRIWQQDELNRISEHINNNHNLIKMGLIPKIYNSATASGRGPGKSALVAWLSLWNLTCNLGSTTIVSANTEGQLKTKTFAEIGKWRTLCIAGHWFEKNTLSLSPQPWFADALQKARSINSDYYYCNGVLWNEDNPDSFAGAHNEAGMMVIFDEASGIPQPIWTVSEGFFSDISPYRFWFVFSNPRANSGPFFECFHKHREYWYTRKIDSRAVEGLDHNKLNEIVTKYGENSREARVEVKGEFPEQGDRQFISRGAIDAACVRTLERYDDFAPLLMGVDPARFGDDSSVVRFRRGRDARSIPAMKYKGLDNMALANACANLIDQFNPDAVFVDAGAGAGVIDRLRQLGYRVFEVWFGSESTTPEYADHRTELWARMKEWLDGSMIDDDQNLKDDLAGPEFDFSGREDKKKLESKDSMKKRGLSSPDNADALAVTFHAKVARTDLGAGSKSQTRPNRKAKGRDYKVFG